MVLPLAEAKSEGKQLGRPKANLSTLSKQQIHI